MIYSNVFDIWWNKLSEAEQIDVRAVVKMLKTFGIDLGFPYSSKINHSPLKTKQMRELRTKHKGKPYPFSNQGKPRNNSRRTCKKT